MGVSGFLFVLFSLSLLFFFSVIGGCGGGGDGLFLLLYFFFSFENYCLRAAPAEEGKPRR